MRPTANNQGVYELLHFSTNRVITRYDIKSVAITPAVIKQVHAIAKSDKMPSGFKIKDRIDAILFDASWTAGVEYDEELFDEQVEDDYYQSDESSTDTKESDFSAMDENVLADTLEDQYIVQNKEDDITNNNKEHNENSNED